VTVCNNAANEMCPNFKGKYKKLHWDLDDPAAVLEE
jgi:arsenate reductase